MTKAEERALEFLPYHPIKTIERQRKRFRGFYRYGYDQGQRDLIIDIRKYLEAINHPIKDAFKD